MIPQKIAGREGQDATLPVQGGGRVHQEAQA